MGVPLQFYIAFFHKNKAKNAEIYTFLMWRIYQTPPFIKSRYLLLNSFFLPLLITFPSKEALIIHSNFYSQNHWNVTVFIKIQAKILLFWKFGNICMFPGKGNFKMIIIFILTIKKACAIIVKYENDFHLYKEITWALNHSIKRSSLKK